MEEIGLQFLRYRLAIALTYFPVVLFSLVIFVSADGVLSLVFFAFCSAHPAAKTTVAIKRSIKTILSDFCISIPQKTLPYLNDGVISEILNRKAKD
jgi:hypothetical protein